MTKATRGDGPAKAKPPAKTRTLKKPAGRERKGGCKTVYKAAFVEQARKLCQLGATDAEVADFFEVDRSTLHRWRTKHPALAEAMGAGKDLADERVVRALYQKAVGYTFESEKIFCHEGAITRARTVEHVPPSDTACIFWLKNRRREDWRDKQEVGLSGSVEVTGPGISGLLGAAREAANAKRAGDG